MQKENAQIKNDQRRGTVRPQTGANQQPNAPLNSVRRTSTMAANTERKMTIQP